MSTVIDSRIFRNIFSTEAINAVWSDKTRTSYYLEFEAALAKVQAKLNIIPERAAEEIAKHCRWDDMDIDDLREQTELIGYPVLGVVRQIVKKVNAIEPQLGEWTHWGATTQVSCLLQGTSRIGSYGNVGLDRYGNGASAARYAQSCGGRLTKDHPRARGSGRKAQDYTDGGTEQSAASCATVVWLQDGSSACILPASSVSTRRIEASFTGPGIWRCCRHSCYDLRKFFIRRATIRPEESWSRAPMSRASSSRTRTRSTQYRMALRTRQHSRGWKFLCNSYVYMR